MSGPVTTEDASPDPAHDQPSGGAVVLEPGRQAMVGELPVHRLLPRRTRRTVGAWCFADHMGPVAVTEEHGSDIGPHPHTGLQTVTWLVSGELLHRDSLGSVQVIKAGQLNLMTAGLGVAHAEENTGHFRGPLQGIQLWVAQPEHTRSGAAAFEHHAELPRLDLDGAQATVLVGDFGGVASPARRDTDHVGVELVLGAPGTLLPLRPDCEYTLIVLEGAVALGGQVARPGVLAYLGEGREECRLDVRAPARALLLGGLPFPEPIVMWWNFVGRSREEMSEARRAWTVDDGRFGTVRSALPRIEVGPPLGTMIPPLVTSRPNPRGSPSR